MPTRRSLLAGSAAALLMPHTATAGDVAGDFDDLIYGTPHQHAEALANLRTRGGVDLVAGLILSFRFIRSNPAPINDLLREITGDTTRNGWFDWMLWQEAHPEITPHPSYINLKRDLFLRIDPNFNVFLRPDHLEPARMKVRLEEITWGGVRKDGIPSLDNPELVAAENADYLLETDLVFGVSINGDARAYPLRIMGWHEMFNDVIGGVPLALAYCTLCGSGILFETKVEQFEEPMLFGSSGFLYRSNKLMFDRTTHSLWNQFTGRPVSGQLADSGIELRQRPVVIEPWGAWKARNPGTRVLSLNTGHRRDYGAGVVYQEYFASADLMFPVNVDQSRLLQKDYVFGIRAFGAAKAWALTAFKDGKVINDRVGDVNVVLIGDKTGRTVRAYDRGKHWFSREALTGELINNGETWHVKEEHLIGPDGSLAPRIAGHIAYWFAWNGYLGAEADLAE